MGIESANIQRLLEENAMLKRQAADHQRLLQINQTLLGLTSAVSTCVDLESLYPEIHRQVGQVVDTTNFYIALYEESSNTISFPYNVDVVEDNSDPQQDVTARDSLTARVVHSQDSLLITKAEILALREQTGRPIVLGVIPEIWLGVPLVAPTRMVGAMVVQSYEQPGFYDVSDVEFMNMVAAIVAIAIERKQFEVRLQESTGRFRRVLEEVDDIAIQGYDEKRRVIFWNKASADLYGYSSIEALGRSLEDLIILPQMRSEVIRLHENWLSTGERIEAGELNLIDKAGRDVPVFSSHVMQEWEGEKEMYCIDFSLKPIKEVEQRLIATNAQFAAAMDSLDALVYVADMQTYELLFINDAVKKAFGAEIGDTCWKVLQSEQQGPCPFCSNAQIVDEHGEPSEVYIWEFQNTRTGTWYQCRDRAIRWPDGRLVRLEIAINITSRKETEHQLKESEERFRALHDASFSGICIHDRGKLVDCNRRLQEIIGYSREELLGMNALDLFAPEFHAKFISLLKNPNSDVWYAQGVRKDGSVCDVELQGKDFPYRGNMVRVVEVRDVTESIKAKKQLEESELRHRIIFENSPLGMAFINENGTIRDCNDRFLELMGLNRDTIEGFNFLEHSSPVILEAAGQALNGREMVAEDFKPSLTGKQRAIHVRFNPVTPGIAPAEVIATIEDITGRIQAEQEVRESAERFKTFFSAINDAVLVHPFRPDGFANFIEVNDVACARYGYSREQFLKISPKQLNSPEFNSEHGAQRHRRNLLERGQLVFEAVHCTSSGEEFPVEISANIVEQKGQKVILSVVRDISERKKVEQERAELTERLAQTEKLESIGRLAGGVAHDFNNMLGVILGRTEMVLEETDAESEHFLDLKEVHQAATRSAILTRQLLTFARRQEVVPQVIDINEKISDILVMLSRLIGEDIDLVWRPAADAGYIRIDPGQVDQLLTNLCVNSRDAIELVGRITISTKQVRVAESRAILGLVLEPGDYVALEVSDTGCGIENEQFEKLFEPFFTTKEVGKGTGLGLATVYGIVTQSKGVIEVASSPASGTTFTLYFPRYTSMAGDKASSSRGMQGPSETATILIVEDEEALLTLTCTMLRRLGYNVLSATTPREGLLKAQEADCKIHVLITDVIMPQMDGQKLAEEFRALYPEAGCLFISGYTDDILEKSGVVDGSVMFMQKPFTKKELSNKLREILGS